MTSIVADRPVLGAPVPWTFPPFEHTRLGPGLDLHHCQLSGRGLVAVDLLLDGPMVVEDLGRAGVGTLAGWALDEGTDRRDADAFAAALDRVGATLSTGIGSGGFRVSLDVPVANLVAALDLLAEAAATPTFPDREVDRLVRQRLDQIRQQLARPDGRAAIAARGELVTPDHRASLPTGGTAETVDGLDRDAIAGFHRDHLLTGPAGVVVAGDLAGTDLRDVVAERFGRWVDVERSRHARRPVTAQQGPRVVVVDRPGSVQTQLVVGRGGPDRHADDWPALRVAAHVLGGTLTSRLDAVLREELGYTYGVRTRLHSYRGGGVIHHVSGSVHTDVTADAVARALEIIGGLAEHGPTEVEVDGAVDYLAGVRPLTLETPRALVGAVTGNLQDDLPADHTETALRRLREVSRDEAADAAATHLSTDGLIVVAVGDADAIADDLAAVGHAEVEVRAD